MLEAKNASVTFHSGWGVRPVRALKNVSLESPGKTTGLMGPSGCGKSTLARVLLRLIPANEGSVIYNGTDITGIVGKKPLPFRRRVQLITQRPEGSFDPSMKLIKSMIEPLKIFGIYEKKASEKNIFDVLEQVKLTPHLLDRYPHQVSGGEIQRLAICRALLLGPEILVLDEPTSMLDVSVQAQILRLLKELQGKKGLAYLFVSHDREVVEWMADRIISMKDGEIFG